MSFDLPEDLKLLKATVRRFVDNELISIEGKTYDGVELKPEYRERLEKRTKEIGLWLMDVPEEYGGQGLDLLGRVVVWEEMGRTIAVPIRVSILGPNVWPTFYALNDEMKERYLYPVIRGEKIACFAQTEPDSGSDPGSMRTTAVHDGDFYVINGVKRFITKADQADFGVVLAATDRSKGSHGGISCFIVDMGTPGVSVPVKYRIVTGEDLCEIVFDNVRIPAPQIIGREGEGFALGQGSLGIGRIKQAAYALGVVERCLEMATSFAKQRVTFGRPLAECQSIQWMLVDSFVALHGARLMAYHAAWKFDQGEDVRSEAYITKLHCVEMAYRAVEQCMQIHGASGLTMEFPITTMWRDQRTRLIGEGTTEIKRMAIARQVLKRYG